MTTKGTIEVTARLVEIPEGAIFKRELYEPRSEAPDRRVKEIGGNLRVFEAGQIHRMALQVPIEDCFMGGIVNKYFGQDTGPIYWAVWTNLAKE